MNGITADKIIRPVISGVAIFIAIHTHYAWYWQVAILVALIVALAWVVSAIRLTLAPRNKA